MIEITCFLMTAMFLLAGCGLILRGMKVKNRWGINLARVQCPQCGTPLPAMRRPKNLSQCLWGGSTCAHCGVEVDKWGKLKS